MGKVNVAKMHHQLSWIELYFVVIFFQQEVQGLWWCKNSFFFYYDLVTTAALIIIMREIYTSCVKMLCIIMIHIGTEKGSPPSNVFSAHKVTCS